MPYVKQPCVDCRAMIRKPAVRCRSCHDLHQRGVNNPAWKGGISLDNMHYKRLQKERYPEKVRARSMVYSAIRAGRLVRLRCEWPGCCVCEEQTQAHHWSYALGDELEVTFLCRDHHRQADQMSRKEFDLVRFEAWYRARKSGGTLGCD